MRLESIEVGKVVIRKDTNVKNVILGIEYSNALENYVYTSQNRMLCLKLYPYQENLFQTCLNPELLDMQDIRNVTLGKESLDKKALELWIVKSAMQNNYIKEELKYCRTDTEKLVPFLQKEHELFMKYFISCKYVESNHNEFYEFSLSNLKVGECYKKGGRANEDTFIYIGNDLFLQTGMFWLKVSDFVLCDSIYDYVRDIYSKDDVNLKGYYDTKLNIFKLAYNENKIKETLELKFGNRS